MVDRSLWPQMGRFDPRGVNPQLVWNVRQALDDAGYGSVRIVVSGGFTADKIRRQRIGCIDQFAIGQPPIMVAYCEGFQRTFRMAGSKRIDRLVPPEPARFFLREPFRTQQAQHRIYHSQPFYINHPYEADLK